MLTIRKLTGSAHYLPLNQHRFLEDAIRLTEGTFSIIEDISSFLKGISICLRTIRKTSSRSSNKSATFSVQPILLLNSNLISVSKSLT